MSENFVEDQLDEFKKGLKIGDRERVVENEVVLDIDHILEEVDPEPYTVRKLVEPILDQFDIEKLDEKRFRDIKGDIRKADLLLKDEKGRKVILEAKKANEPLENKCIDQAKNLFRLADVKEEYEFGIATDGFRWVITDENRKIVHDLDIREDFGKLKEVLTGKEEVKADKIKKKISDRFYKHYDAILHGGDYKTPSGTKKSISEEDCLVENIARVEDKNSREIIAQSTIDRLIFIRFLQSKGIIDFDALDYISDQDNSIINEKLKQLFFDVLNTKEDDRVSPDPKFEEIPYLNGSLFTRNQSEKENINYRIEPEILKETIDFLDKYSFTENENGENRQSLDPEILGYIFEKAMTDAERKSTGSYYTPRDVTGYISRNTIEKSLLNRVNDLLRDKGYKETELIDEVDSIYNLRDTTLKEVFSEVLMDFKVCDNACGSGAFLLLSAEILLDIYSKINDELGLKNSKIALKKLILKNNIYGVDINPNAVSIAKLRLWLWIVQEYDKDTVEPLPNIDYNLRTGNSLVGYKNIDKFKDQKVSVLDWMVSEESIQYLIKSKQKKIEKVKSREGDLDELNDEIEDLNSRIDRELDNRLYSEIEKSEDIPKESFMDLDPFHWEIEFPGVFKDGEGFDVIVGNPPYINMQKLDNLRKYCRAKHEEVYTGQNDIIYYFFSRSINTLRDSGQLGFITSRYFLESANADKLRSFLSEKSNIAEIIDFRNYQVFGSDINVLSAITLLEKSDESSETTVRKARRSLDSESYILQEFEKIPHTDLFVDVFNVEDNFSDSSWNLINPQIKPVMDKMEKEGEKLEEIADIGQGMTTGRNTVFVIDDAKAEELDIEDEILKNYIKTGDLSKFAFDEREERLIYLTSDTPINSYPNALEYLEENKEDLKSRYACKQDKCEWYELANPRNRKLFEKETEKIVTPLYSTSNKFVYDPGDEDHTFYTLSDTYIVVPKDDNEHDFKTLTGVLNSYILEVYFKNIAKLKRDGYFEYSTGSLEKLSVKIPDNAEDLNGKIEKLADEEEPEKDQKFYEVNARIAESYGISEEELENLLEWLYLDEDRIEKITNCLTK